MVVALERRSPGQWTRRLDVTLGLRNKCEDLERIVKHLTYVIKSLPKLEIVSFAIPHSLGSEPGFLIMPLGALDALRRSANSLRILDWSGNDFFPQPHQLEELLRDLPNLRVLRCYQLVWANGIIPSNILSSLTTLAVSGLVGREGHPGEGVLHDACVSLREFIYYGGSSTPQEFLIHYGKYLTVLKWYSYSLWYNNELDLALKSCPNLDRLTIRLGSLDPSVDSRVRTLSFPCVSYLGVKPIEFLTFQGLFEFLAHLRNTVPTLRVFQLINPPIVGQLLTRPLEFSTELIVKNLNENPFRVEDDEGNLLSGWCRISSLTLTAN
ncbi:hypothetical protein EDD15DRAFT_2444262 [Pisolithus albus]|nr:hypothetical protein EDD15DRAFT_2444262 [Pisolithus albus]